MPTLSEQSTRHSTVSEMNWEKSLLNLNLPSCGFNTRLLIREDVWRKSSKKIIDGSQKHKMESAIKCKVCNVEQKNTNHNYYGSTNICSSCRNFFRRTVLSKKHLGFKCFIRADGGGCVIDSIARESCKKCRYKKCLEVGMKPSWVSSELGDHLIKESMMQRHMHF